MQTQPNADSTKQSVSRLTKFGRLDQHPLGTTIHLQPRSFIRAGYCIGSTPGTGARRVHQHVGTIITPVVIDGGAHRVARLLHTINITTLVLGHHVSLAVRHVTLNPIVFYAATMSQRSPQVTPSEADTPAEDRVHHHARVEGSRDPIATGTIITLCGLHLPGPRPGAAKLPCCPLCALSMGKPCS